MEENEVKELPTENGVYTEIKEIDTIEIPKLTDEEADQKESEILPDEEGGK